MPDESAHGMPSCCGFCVHLLARHDAVLNFTSVEMRGHEQPQEAQCMPEALVWQVGTAGGRRRRGRGGGLGLRHTLRRRRYGGRIRPRGS